jgi:hypothetical protein
VHVCRLARPGLLADGRWQDVKDLTDDLTAGREG